MKKLLHFNYKNGTTKPVSLEFITSEKPLVRAIDLHTSSLDFFLDIKHHLLQTQINFNGVKEDLILLVFDEQLKLVTVKFFTSGFKGDFGLLIPEKKLIFLTRPNFELSRELESIHF